MTVIAKGVNKTYGAEKLVSKMGKNLLSIGQLTRIIDTLVKFEGNHCVIQLRYSIIATARRGSDKLYRIEYLVDHEVSINLVKIDEDQNKPED